MGKSFNKSFKRSARPSLSLEDYIQGISQGNITILSQAITLVESSIPSDRKQADEIIERCMNQNNSSVRIGITGVPGVGKSTFIETFGGYLTSENHNVAVLAIDPSSQNSGGSILGDKTRMESLVQNPNVFIRPSPSKGSLGGVAQATRETIILCEAAGYDIILIETVGVGQSEIAVRSMVDFFLLLMLAGAGDELQGIKRGIMEMADAVVITKADGENLKNAKRAMLEYKNALHLFPASKSQWIPKVEHCSALQNYNLNKVWEIIESYKNLTINNGYFSQNRSDQANYWLEERIVELLKTDFESDEKVNLSRQILKDQVQNGTISPFKAADKLMKTYHGKKH